MDATTVTTVGSLSLLQPSFAFTAIVVLHLLDIHHPLSVSLLKSSSWAVLYRVTPPQPANHRCPYQEHSSKQFSSQDLRLTKASPLKHPSNSNYFFLKSISCALYYIFTELPATKFPFSPNWLGWVLSGVCSFSFSTSGNLPQPNVPANYRHTNKVSFISNVL